MPKTYRRIAILGGASPLWSPRNIGYMATARSCQGAEVVLVDLSLERAQDMATVLTRMIQRAYPDARLAVRGAATLDEALPGADAVFTCYRNGSHDTEERINAIARQYGSQQSCFTAGPGACLYLAVQGPVLIDLVRRMQRCCPDAWLVNCSNPLPAMVMLAVKAGHHPRKVLGFCGALHWTRKLLARFLQVPPERLEFRIGGTNHCTFITEVYVDGRDAMPLLRQRGREQKYFDLGIWGQSSSEIRILNAIGWLCPGGHPTDILPTLHGDFLPREPGYSDPDEPMNNKLDYSPDFGRIVREYADGKRDDWAPPRQPDVPVSWLEALAGHGSERLFSINTTNLGAVPNLPDWTVPDLECYLDDRGVSPLVSPGLPEVIAETVRRHHVTFEIAARAVLARDGALLREALQLCPFGDYFESAESILRDARAVFGADLIF